MNALTETAPPARIPDGMRPGRREFRDASLTISIPQQLPEHMREGTREISHVFVDPSARRQRLATILLNFVCQEADANSMVLILCARDYGGEDEARMDEDQLVSWYERFGFKRLQDTPQGTMMARQVVPRRRIQTVREAIRGVLH